MGFPLSHDVKRSYDVVCTVNMAAEDCRTAGRSETAELKLRFESSFPIDDLLPALLVKDVLTVTELVQLHYTSQSALVKRNRKFLGYLANKGPSAVSDTLSVISLPEYEAYRHFGEMLREVFGAERNEGEGMRGKARRNPQQGGERGSRAKEVSTLRASHSYAFGWYKVE